MKRFNDTFDSYLVPVPTLTTNLRLQNGNEHWGTDPMYMPVRGFSVTEENICLALCIAVGESGQNLQTIFFIVNKNSPKVEGNFFNYFH